MANFWMVDFMDFTSEFYTFTYEAESQSIKHRERIRVPSSRKYGTIQTASQLGQLGDNEAI